MEKLQLKHLAGYLPYSLRFRFQNKWNNIQIVRLASIDIKDNEVEIINQNNITFFSKIYGIKPILRPLSDLTKEIEVNGEKFVPLARLLNIEGEDYFVDHLSKDKNNLLTKVWLKVDGQYKDYHTFNLLGNLSYSDSVKLLKWHFDFVTYFESGYGLIEKGLAIDINTLNK